MRPIVWFAILVLLISAAAPSIFAADNPAPPAEAFQVLPSPAKVAPIITPYLRYQTEMAWRQDDQRKKKWEGIKTENDLLRVQKEMERQLLAMLGGLPEKRTPLNPQVTGKIPMNGFHIEKLIFESLPGIYVTALVYVPEDGKEKHPGILVPVGHASNGKAHYQALCQHLVKRGYVVICWDPPGQGERSQFWDAKAGKSRYNLICAEHAVMGNLAYLAGTNLARWEIWDGIRAIDYLVSRPDVDSERINVTGTSGGGFQAAHIAALDRRIKVAAPSCYITALPMRVYNRIFKDPDSDPEQDLYGIISKVIDHPGLLLMMYPRPVFVAAAVLDFFPIEGAHKTVREITDIYSRFHHADRIAMAEGYHEHQFSPENQEAAMDFLDHFNGLPQVKGLASVEELDERKVQVTRSGQVVMDFPNARSIMDEIRDYSIAHKTAVPTSLKSLYFSEGYANVNRWAVAEDLGAVVTGDAVTWEKVGSTDLQSVLIDRYLLRHSRYMEMPLLYVHHATRSSRLLLWFGPSGKASAENWPDVMKAIDGGYDVLSIDPRGQGETRMPYKAVSPDDPKLAELPFERAYASPLSGVLADYVYNSVLTGRPYFLQMIEDAEIALRFDASLGPREEIAVTGTGEGYTVATAVSETLPDVKLLPSSTEHTFAWSEVVDQKAETWPIQFLLPSGAHIH